MKILSLPRPMEIYSRIFRLQLPKTSKSDMSSFSWHPSVDNTILSVGAAGKLHYLTIYERIVMSWSPSLDLVWGCGKQVPLLFC